MSCVFESMMIVPNDASMLFTSVAFTVLDVTVIGRNISVCEDLR